MPKENVGIANMETPEKHDGGHRGSRRGGRGGGKRHGSFTGNRRRFNDALHFPNGGTPEDPLNLNGYMSGEDHTPTEEDMKPIEVVIPRNPRDPLNLSTPQSDKKNRKRKNADNAPAPDPNAIVSPVPKPKQRRCSSPLPGKKDNADKPADDEAAKKRKAKKDYFNQKYCYGNFDRYYGTRLQPGETDQRLSILKKEWFEKRTVLDIGCNVGFLTLSIAKTYQPRRILGIDIDEHLVGVARKNIRHYCDDSTEMAGKFPASFSSQFGPASQLPGSYSTKFPDNVWFRKEDYVLECDEHVDAVTEEFDVILALSITKWIHLNYGDDGMRRFFKRAFAHLHPGGRLIIEPQPFSTYKKRSNMTDTLKKHFKEIEFKPEDFEMYLLNECGFERVEHLGVPEAKSKGFERPIDMYVKRPPKFMQKKEKKASKEKEQKDEEKPVEEEKNDATGQSEGDLPTPMES